jgi:hypothetical protein
MTVNEQLTLIADEIPGLIVGNTDEPQGRIMLVNTQGQVLWENTTLKMPYDILPTSNGMTKNGLFTTFPRLSGLKDSPQVWVCGKLDIIWTSCHLYFINS